MALPGTEKGTIVLKTSLEQGAEELFINAHSERRVQNLAVTFDGRFLASVSEHGKRIKIFDVATLQLIRIFRRGFSIKAIESIIFNKINSSICISTADTIRVWNLDINNNPHEEQKESLGFMHKLMSKIGRA